MTPDRAAFVVLEHLRTNFGKLVRIRTPEQRRRAAGPTWCVPVVVVSSEGDIPVAEIDVDEEGRMSPLLDAEDVIRALRAGPAQPEDAGALGGFAQADALFAEIAAEAGAEETEVEASSRKLRDLFRHTDDASLVEARKLLPHLLGRIPYKEAPREKEKLPDRGKAHGYVEPDYPYKFVPEKF